MREELRPENKEQLGMRLENLVDSSKNGPEGRLLPSHLPLCSPSTFNKNKNTVFLQAA